MATKKKHEIKLQAQSKNRAKIDSEGPAVTLLIPGAHAAARFQGSELGQGAPGCDQVNVQKCW